MSKDNYRDTTLINKYKDLVRKPSSSLPLVSVATAEKRTRAELLDILEDLFDSEISPIRANAPVLNKPTARPIKASKDRK